MKKMDDAIKSIYEDWLRYTFEEQPRERDEPYDPNAPVVWYDWDTNPQISVRYIARLFSTPVDSLQGYTDHQINDGLWQLIIAGIGDIDQLLDESIELGLRIQTVKSMFTVFEQLFLPRCTSAISAHKSREQIANHNPLNSVCYMWWDIIPFYGKSGDARRDVFDPHCLDVMEMILQLPSIACQESALHGLGEWTRAYPDRVKRVIDAFLKANTDIDPELREYALDARVGAVL